MMDLNKIYNGNCLEVLKTFEDSSIDCCITSPPYFGLRDYGTDEQIGLEETPEKYVEKLVEVFTEVKRVLKNEATLWLNLGDSYYNYRGAKDYQSKQSISNNKAHEMNCASGKRNIKNDNLKGKDLIGIPWMVAFALRSSGWYLRQDIIWAKPNPMPESVTDRCTKSHEYIFLLSKSAKYYYDHEAIKYKSFTNDNSNRDRDSTKLNNVPGRTRMAGLKTNDYEMSNKRSVWTVNTMPYSDAHFATFPESLITDCIKAGCPENGIVLDPFMGAGTTGLVARKLNRNFVGIELNPDYIKIAEKRLQNQLGMFL